MRACAIQQLLPPWPFTTAHAASGCGPPAPPHESVQKSTNFQPNISPLPRTPAQGLAFYLALYFGMGLVYGLITYAR